MTSRRSVDPDGSRALFATARTGDLPRHWARRLLLTGRNPGPDMNPAHAPATASQPGLPGRPSALRVLVIDDNVDGAEALCALLASMGCVTAVAFDGAQGLATARDFDPHLAFIDLEMPGLDGRDVAHRLRTGLVRSFARLVCLTGRGQPEDRCLCLDAGFDAFFTKPISPERLVDMVAAATIQRTLRRAWA